MVALLITFVASAIGCGDDSASPPGTVIGNARDTDGGNGRNDAGRDAATSARPDGGDSGFDFGDFEVDESPRMPPGSSDKDASASSVPEGWRCAADLGADEVCDCGCGANDPACDPPGCREPGCGVPACQACFGPAGELRDCGAPGIWFCEPERREDGVCDCGCGALDPDCAEGEGCYALGCNVLGCERCQLEDSSAECGPPAAFLCDAEALANGRCDCGCGNLDPECRASSCTEPECSALGCDICHDAAGDAIDCAQTASSCAASRFGDGVCDCGCGQDDPDCDGDGCAAPGCSDGACDACHDALGRTVTCAGSWSCPPERAGDGFACDCGCGAADPDCGAKGCSEPGCSAEGCDVTYADGAPMLPAAFSCDPARFADEPCDCGCGAFDPACSGGCSEPGCRAQGCDRCVDGQGDDVECRWSCAAALLADGMCDCGCGALDPDCGASACEKPGCFAEGCGRCFDSSGQQQSCDRSACPPGYQGDGVCDCGCRDDDIDCIAVRDCVEPGCSESGCGRCHDASGAVVQCADFICELEQQGGDDGCNCGCGAADADCGTGGCVSPGCRAEACVTCRSASGAPMSCAP